MKRNYKNKKAFTLIELLIVIAIIGILFVVLVSKVDFATDKAKATGVQTDFRSFQVAFDHVAKENAGFASLGWDTGDENGNRKRDSYDVGDINENGIMDVNGVNGFTGVTEVWTGHKEYDETWFGIYTLVNPDDDTDTSAFEALEAAINANLDPKLHITITPELSGTALTGNAVVTMANGAQDPWKKEYHGVYITNAVVDNGADRGAFVIYSDGANGKNGSEHDIANGIVTVTVPGNNIAGKDDYALAIWYTYIHGYGETVISTSGFSNNQKVNDSISASGVSLTGSGQEYYTTTPTDLVFKLNSDTEITDVKIDGESLDQSQYLVTENNELVILKNYLSTLTNKTYDIVVDTTADTSYGTFVVASPHLNSYNFYYNQPYGAYVPYFDGYTAFLIREDGTLDAILVGNEPETCTYTIDGDRITIESASIGTLHALVENNGQSIHCQELDTSFTLDNSTIVADNDYFYIYNAELNGYEVAAIDATKSSYPAIRTGINGYDTVAIASYGFANNNNLTALPPMPTSIVLFKYSAFRNCESLKNIVIPNHVTRFEEAVFMNTGVTSITLHTNMKYIAEHMFADCYYLTRIVIPESVTTIAEFAFVDAYNLANIVISSNVKHIQQNTFADCSSLTSIVFNGTVDEWNAILFDAQWNYNVPATKVICSDGVVDLQ